MCFRWIISVKHKNPICLHTTPSGCILLLLLLLYRPQWSLYTYLEDVRSMDCTFELLELIKIIQFLVLTEVYVFDQ